MPDSIEDLALTLIVRKDRTFDYRFAQGMKHSAVTKILRQIADQIEQGATMSDPGIPSA